MTNITIHEHDRYYEVIDGFTKFTQYSKDNITDMNLMCEFLVDELKKANDKQSQWFEKYWELKKQLNAIKDIMGENR